MNYDYLGSSMQYPASVDSYGKAGIVQGIDSVKQSIDQILSTPEGSRFFLPEWGSRLHEVCFEPADEVLESLLRLFIFEALDKWERRIQYLDSSFTFNSDENAVYCDIQYQILASNKIDSFIFPFYRSLKY